MGLLKFFARGSADFFCVAAILTLAPGCLDFNGLSSAYLSDGGAPTDGGPDLFQEAAHCTDRHKDVDETDVDCGGSCGATCTIGQGCRVNGDCYTDACSISVCVPASGPPSWVMAAPLHYGRQRAAAATDAQGRVYLIGGTAPTMPAAEERFDPATGAWSDLPRLPTPRSWLVAARADDGNIYAMGGESGGVATNLVEVFNVTAAGWSAAPGADQLPFARAASVGFIGAVGDVVVAGGHNANGALGDLSEFFAGITTWTTGNVFPTAPRDQLSGALGSDHHYYFFGGHAVVDMIDTYYDNVDIFANGVGGPGTWSVGPPLPTPRFATGAATGADGRMYLAGGEESKTGSTGASTPNTGEVLVLDLALQRWLTVAPLQTPRHSHSMAIGGDGRLYVIGGAAGGGVLDTVEAYGPSLTVEPPMGAAGSMVAAGGGNFAKNARVQFFWAAETVPAATGTTDGTGALVGMVQLTVPQAALGPLRLRAVDDKSVYPSFFTFTVK